MLFDTQTNRLSVYSISGNKRLELECVDQKLSALSLSLGAEGIESAVKQMRSLDVDTSVHERALAQLQVMLPSRVTGEPELFKDQILDQLLEAIPGTTGWGIKQAAKPKSAWARLVGAVTGSR